MITLSQFAKLRHGDVVRWKSGRTMVYRTVIEGPADRGSTPKHPTHLHVSFPIRHRSWTGRAYTSYGFHDVKHFITPTTRRRNTVCSPLEAAHLQDHRFDVAVEYRRELKERAERNARMGRACPFKPLPLPANIHQEEAA